MKRAALVLALLVGSAGVAEAAKVAPLNMSSCTTLVNAVNLSADPTVVRDCAEYISQSNTYKNDAFPGSGTIYYFCDCQAGADANCVAGSDSNACTSPSAPCQTASKFATLYNGVTTPGAVTTFAFCRAGEWVGGSGSLANTHFDASHVAKIRDYGPGQGMPWTPAVDWQPAMNMTSAVWAFDFKGSVSPVDSGWTTVENIEVTGTTGGGVHVSNGAHNITVGNMVLDGLVTAAFEVDGNASYPTNCYTPGATDAAAPVADTCLAAHDFQIFGSYVLGKGALTMGALVVGDNTLLQGVVMVNAGSDASNDHAIYFHHVEPSGTGNFTHPAHDEKVLYSLFVDSGTGPSGTNKCDGVEIVAHDIHIRLEIGYSAIIQTLAQTITGNCYGIQTNGGSAGTNYFIATNIHDNLMWEMGQIGIDFGSDRGGTIKNNRIYSANVPAGPTKFIGINLGDGNAGIVSASSGRDAVVAGNTIINGNSTTQSVCIFYPTSASSGFINEGNICDLTSASAAAQYFMWFQNGMAVLAGGKGTLGGTISLSNYTAITNGGIHFPSINGTNCLIASGITFAAATGMGPTTSGVGGILQVPVRACGGNAANAVVEYMGGAVEPYFNVSTSAGSTPTAIAVADCTGVSGTCIADSFGLSTTGGAVVATLTTTDRNLAFASGPGFKWEAVSGKTLAQFQSSFSQDANSKNADPKFVSTLASGFLPFTPRFDSPAVYGGTATYQLSTDMYGSPRSTPPDIGATQRWRPAIPMQ